MSLKDASFVAVKSARTVRNWCADHGIRRRVGNGTWVVSRPALAMFLDGDLDALASYQDFGVRAKYEPVARHYHRVDLGHLLDLPEFSV